ncbi:uncharacterized protein TNIN_193171 [Trichonephila inaurata madagascariensis]|uniref:Uncharacterized protein n=1 Tax=Trichonephila inaurata madagascariensis TaxID=2747483 RepID=A0A8X6IN13_9ARAC|nr:uncharacterized protein TNIN_193171 [Trichonephila inaurata madagascariensis]
MGSTSTDDIDSAEKEADRDIDPKPIVPLRQRRFPASFWQEPSIVPTSSAQDIPHQIAPSSLNQNFPMGSAHPWTMSSSTTGLATFLPQRLSIPNNVALVQYPSPMWIRNPVNYCNCAMCLNYSYVIPRFPDVYSGLRYRPTMSASQHCSRSNCADQSCKLCSATYSWHPERIRQARLRSARYNALLD